MTAHIHYTEKTEYTTYSCPCGKSKVKYIEAITDSGGINWFIEPRGIHVGLKYSLCEHCNNYYYNGNNYFQDLKMYEKILYILCYNIYFLPSVRMIIIVRNWFPNRDDSIWRKLVCPLLVVPIVLLFALLLGLDFGNFLMITLLNVISFPYHLVVNPIRIIRSKKGFYKKIDDNHRPSSLNDVLDLFFRLNK